MADKKNAKQKDQSPKQLTAEQYRILKEKGTERPFSGEFLNHKEKGTYTCAACGNPLFSSEAKFDSASGWPSFFDVVDQGQINLIKDNSHGMIRTEVVCSNCGGHLGHLFDDGPTDQSGLRYCINSLSLDFDQEGN